MGRFYLLRLVFLAFLLVAFCRGASAQQSYGLGFYGHEIDQDKRTSLNLTPAGPLCFKDNFELSFDLGFLTGRKTYFGYIFRIIENDKRNFDLLYDDDNGIFTLIIGEELTGIKFTIPRSQLYSRWNKLRIKFNVAEGNVVLKYDKQVYSHRVNLLKDGCYQIFYGANADKSYGSADVPPMKVRDVRIYQQKTLKYYWPLDEKNGTEASEIVNKGKAKVINPIWLKADHYYWKLLNTFTVNGMPSTAFNAEKEEVYVVANDSLYTYKAGAAALRRSGFPYKNNWLNIGNQAIYNRLDKLLYNFYIDDKFITAYHDSLQAFDKPFVATQLTDNIQLNKFVSGVDTALYIIGGYGHHLYKNSITRYSFTNKQWSTVKPTGDFMIPRYLAALGATPNGDTAYIVGGYGNESGKQILKPRNIYDMLRFTVKDKKLKKLFELQPVNGDFVFGNSLIINEKEKSYYGLIFPELKFNSELQLIKGSLSNNSYIKVGNTIPYSFNDIRTYADVFYCPASKKFIVVTMLRTMDDKRTEVKIFGLSGPPETAVSKVVYTQPFATRRWVILAAVVALLLVTVGVLVWIRNKQWRKKAVANIAPQAGQSVAPAADVAQQIIADTAQPDRRAQIYLFGELQLVTANGEEIVSQFTRLTKELFVFLFIHSIRWKRGVSAEKLIEILWFDKDEKSARNNRSVNMAKLKNVLDLLGPCTISRNTGYYKIDVDHNEINVDYHNFLQIVLNPDRLTKQTILQLTQITQRGSFLSNCEYEWLDQQKAEVTDAIIDTYIRYIQANNIADDPEFSIKIANHIFQHDQVNEEAMRIKCRALVHLGKHSLAKSTFENFKKDYKSIYLEDFKEDYQSILK